MSSSFQSPIKEKLHDIRSYEHQMQDWLPVFIFLFAAAVEFAQYFRIVNVLHFENSRLLSTIIGSTFEIKDLLCYLAAMVILIVWEYIEATKIRIIK